MSDQQTVGLPCITEGANDIAVYQYSGKEGIVSEVQKELLDYYNNRSMSDLPKPVIDGVLSPANRTMIAIYQQEFGLDVDGVVGEQTYSHMGIGGPYLPCGTHTLYQDYSTSLQQMKDGLMAVDGQSGRVGRVLTFAALGYLVYLLHKNRQMIVARASAMLA